MKKTIPELSLPRFNFDNGCWCPTLDIAKFLSQSPNAEISELTWWEERDHRVAFVGSDTRLWMTWMEFLTNYEFVCFLSGVKELQRKDENFTLSIPIDIHLRDVRFPRSLKLQIRKLRNTLMTIKALQKICEPIIEAVTTYAVSELFQEVPKLAQIAAETTPKKLEKYGLNTIYPMVQRLYSNVEEKIFVLLLYVFGPLTKDSRNNFPQLYLSNYYKDFNNQVFQIIPRRFDEIIKLFGKKSFSRVKLNRFIEKNIRSPELVQSNLIEKAVQALDKLYWPICDLSKTEEAKREESEAETEVSEIAESSSLSIYEMAFPLLSLLKYSREITNESIEVFDKINIKPDSSAARFLLDTPPFFIIENIANKKIDTCTWKLMPPREEIGKGIRKAYNITILKYFFLTGKMNGLFPMESIDYNLLGSIVDGLRYENKIEELECR